MNPRIYLFVSICCLLLSCEDKEQKLLDLRASQLENISEFGATPLHDEFQKASEELATKVEAFTQAPDLNQLQAVREQWKSVGQLFKRCELYDIGEVNSSFIHYRIHRWPTNEGRMEDSLAASSALTMEKVSNLGSSLVGLASLEYLLFENDADQTLEQFQASPRRLEYLLLCSQYLSNQAAELNKIWKSYSPTYVTSLQSAIIGGQNQSINSLVSFMEETSKTRLGKAMGEDDGGNTDST
ncbi:MAG: imelysin family protein, partial [Bacteroidota bacterium]